MWDSLSLISAATNMLSCPWWQMYVTAVSKLANPSVHILGESSMACASQITVQDTLLLFPSIYSSMLCRLPRKAVHSRRRRRSRSRRKHEQSSCQETKKTWDDVDCHGSSSHPKPEPTGRPTPPFQHPQHPLLQISLPYLFTCMGCKEYGAGMRFRCQTCGFDLHDFCALAPPALHNHPFHHKHQLVFFTKPGRPPCTTLFRFT